MRDNEGNELTVSAGVKAAGASGIIRPGKNACQVIVGTKVKSVYDELDKLLK